MCVYIDATYIAVKRKMVSKEAIYIAVGIREDGTKEVLSYAVAPTESAYIWKEMLQDLKECGTGQVLIFISDGLSGIVNAIQEIYPQAKYQTCCVHLARNIAIKFESQIGQRSVRTSNPSIDLTMNKLVKQL